MKNTLLATAALLAFFNSGIVQAAEVPAPCRVLMDEIQRKIVRNGVPATDFILSAVPAGEVGQAQGKVVGNCGFGSHRVMYVRGDNINPAAAQPNPTPTPVQPEAEPESEPEFQPESIASVEPVEATASNRADENADSSAPEQNIDAEAPNTVVESDLETAAAQPLSAESAKPRPKIIIMPPDDNALFQGNMTDAEGSIIIHR